MTPRELENTTTLYARKREFGFLCPAFTVGLSRDGYLLMRSKDQLLKRSLLPKKVATRDLTGRYTLEVHSNAYPYCKIPVIVAWAVHPSMSDPFLVIKVREPHRLRRTLRPLFGKDVEVILRPRLAPHLLRPLDLAA